MVEHNGNAAAAQVPEPFDQGEAPPRTERPHTIQNCSQQTPNFSNQEGRCNGGCCEKFTPSETVVSRDSKGVGTSRRSAANANTPMYETSAHNPGPGRPREYNHPPHNPTYDAVRAARQRCRNPSHRDHDRYKGKLHPEWCARDGQHRMYEWIMDNLGPKPTKQHSLDRIDPAGCYEPGNLRWATKKQQTDNRSFHLHQAGMQRGSDLHDLFARTLWVVHGRAWPKANDKRIRQMKQLASEVDHAADPAALIEWTVTNWSDVRSALQTEGVNNPPRNPRLDALKANLDVILPTYLEATKPAPAPAKPKGKRFKPI